MSVIQFPELPGARLRRATNVKRWLKAFREEAPREDVLGAHDLGIEWATEAAFEWYCEEARREQGLSRRHARGAA